jgi:hypothetical protein
MPARSTNFFARIGRTGGIRSRRTLDADTARAMVRVREARRAYKRFYARCFWSYRADLDIGISDVEWVAEQLRRHGNRDAWMVASRLCR